MDLGVDRGTVAALASGASPLVTSVSEAIVLAVDPALATVFAGPTGRDPYEVVVFGDGNDARKDATIRRC